MSWVALRRCIRSVVLGIGNISDYLRRDDMPPWICAKCGHEFGWGTKPYVPCPECGDGESIRAYELPIASPSSPKTFQEAAYLAAKETADLVIKKQKDYGPSNIVALGELGIFVRLWDKINRMLTLLWRPLLAGQPPQEAQNEPLDDTWDDIPGYCLCRKMLKRGWFELPIEGRDG